MWSLPKEEGFATRYLNHATPGVRKLASMRQQISHLRDELSHIQSRLAEARSDDHDLRYQRDDLIGVFQEKTRAMAERHEQALNNQQDAIRQQQGAIHQLQLAVSLLLVLLVLLVAVVLGGVNLHNHTQSIDHLQGTVATISNSSNTAVINNINTTNINTAELCWLDQVIVEVQGTVTTIVNRTDPSNDDTNMTTCSTIPPTNGDNIPAVDNSIDTTTLRCQLPNGEGHYTGEWMDGVWGSVPHGKGTKEYGRAAAVRMRGAVYHGDLVNGLLQGQGKITYSDGVVYEGGWHQDKCHGRGKIIWSNGRSYEGDYKHGRWHGQGTFTYYDGRVYIGAWVNDMKHGIGKETNADGSTLYDGLWENGEPKK
jgi:hypothetical protein